MSLPVDLAARLAASEFVDLACVALELDGWPNAVVAVDLQDMLNGTDVERTFGRLVKIRDTASAMLEHTPWTPVVADVEFPSDGLPSYYAGQLVPFADPQGFSTSLTDPRWGIVDSLVDLGLYVPAVAELRSELANYRISGPGFCPRVEVAESLELRAQRDYAPLGHRPTSDQIHSATDPEGEPIVSSTVADWWMHRWATDSLDSDTLVRWRRWRAVPQTIDDPTMFLLPSTDPAVGGLLPTGSGEHSPWGHQAWAEFVAKWRTDWSAQLVSCGPASTFTVAQPPATIDTALPLAVEHWLFFDGPALAGDSVYEYAYSLVGRTAWLLDIGP